MTNAQINHYAIPFNKLCMKIQGTFYAQPVGNARTNGIIRNFMKSNFRIRVHSTTIEQIYEIRQFVHAGMTERPEGLKNVSKETFAKWCELAIAKIDKSIAEYHTTK